MSDTNYTSDSYTSADASLSRNGLHVVLDVFSPRRTERVNTDIILVYNKTVTRASINGKQLVSPLLKVVSLQL